MSKSKQNPKKTDKKAADSFVWTDDEVELLLKVTMEYKTSRAIENIDWESCQTKYGDILHALVRPGRTQNRRGRGCLPSRFNCLWRPIRPSDNERSLKMLALSFT